jgi:hypothetical protein
LARGEGAVGVFNLALASMMSEVATHLKLEIVPGAEFAAAAQGMGSCIHVFMYVAFSVKWSSRLTGT